MAEWKKSIFVKAIKTRIEKGEGTLGDILETYTKLSEEEKQEIRQEFE